MTELRRILDGGEGNDFERWLLKSAADERPASAVTANLRMSLGLSSASMAAHASSLSSLKLTLLAVSLGALMGVHGTGNQHSSVAARDTQSTSVSEQRQAASTAVFDIAAPTAAYADVTPTDTAPIAASQARLDSKGAKTIRAKERSTPLDRNRTNDGPNLREEIRLLDLARIAIQSHQPEQAMASLNTYASKFESGAFKQEASVLRIQALEQRGDVSRASSMAKQFVESNPNSPYVSRAARIAKNSNTSDPNH